MFLISSCRQRHLSLADGVHCPSFRPVNLGDHCQKRKKKKLVGAKHHAEIVNTHFMRKVFEPHCHARRSTVGNQRWN
jgi:hypothetical protein